MTAETAATDEIMRISETAMHRFEPGNVSAIQAALRDAWVAPPRAPFRRTWQQRASENRSRSSRALSMRDALSGLRATARGATAVEVVTRAAEAVGHDPWAVVQQAGVLARAAWVPAPHDLGLTDALRVTRPDHPEAIVTVSQGAPFPRFDRTGRQRRAPTTRHEPWLVRW